jgi:hypothetical protein
MLLVFIGNCKTEGCHSNESISIFYYNTMTEKKYGTMGCNWRTHSQTDALLWNVKCKFQEASEAIFITMAIGDEKAVASNST